MDTTHFCVQSAAFQFCFVFCLFVLGIFLFHFQILELLRLFIKIFEF